MTISEVHNGRGRLQSASSFTKGLCQSRSLPPQDGASYRLGELFCGPGGLALGATQARVVKGKAKYRIVPVWANDFDRDTCDTYRNNICSDKPEKVVCEDVHKLDFSRLGGIDALAFGFPCNDFSVVGEKKGTNGTYGPLYSYGVKALKHFQPSWFLAENVGGLRHANEGRTFEHILKELFNAGYDIFPDLYEFEDYGVPQARHRIIIVGLHKDLRLRFRMPAPTGETVTCKEAIENPPIPSYASNHELTVQNKDVVERLKHIKPGQNAFTADIPARLRLNVGKVKISQIYKRLDPDKPAYTITGCGGGGTHMYHWKEPRALTNRERARLQTFPDSFVFSGAKESVRRQVGMAVPPKAAKLIFEAILKTMAGIKYDSVEATMEPMIHFNGTLESYENEKPECLSSEMPVTAR